MGVIGNGSYFCFNPEIAFAEAPTIGVRNDSNYIIHWNMDENVGNELNDSFINNKAKFTNAIGQTENLEADLV